MRLPLSSSAHPSRLPNRRSRHFISRHPAQLTALVLMAALLAAAIGGPITGAAPPSFAAKQDFATGPFPISVTVGDLNGDGKLDLAIANNNSSTVSVLLNTTTPGAAIPSFAAKQDFATGILPASVTVGDVNLDGKLDLAVANANSNTVSVLLNTFTPTAANGNVSGRIVDLNGIPVAGVAIRMSGTQSRITITDSNGDYHFDNVETTGFYTVTPSRPNYTFSPTQRSFSQLGQHTDAAFTASANNIGSIVNPLNTTEFFVRHQYLDFLGREPDEAGFTSWVNGINNCAAGDTSCDRIHVAEMFFRSSEFRDRGYYIYRFYSTAFGRKPDYAEFTPDMKRISGFLTTDQLEAAKMQFAIDFTKRPFFVSTYGSLSNAAYVDALINAAQVSLANRQTIIDALDNGAIDRAHALRLIAESSEVYQKYYNQAFVVMEYFGYLRRDPDALYLEWIDVLNQTGDARHMVEGFVDSTEYRNRFQR